MLNTILQNAPDGAEVLTEGEPVEKTLSIIELISSGGLAGQIIIAILFLLLVVPFIFILNVFLLLKQLQS